MIHLPFFHILDYILQLHKSPGSSDLLVLLSLSRRAYSVGCVICRAELQPRHYPEPRKICETVALEKKQPFIAFDS